MDIDDGLGRLKTIEEDEEIKIENRKEKKKRKKIMVRKMKIINNKYIR